jgi:tRNA modification GTPase
VSAVTGQGIDALLSTIRERAAEGAADRGIVVRERQHRALTAAVEMLRQVGGTAQEEIVAELLRSAGDAIGAVSGQVGAEQVLDRIFSEFCIGK